MAEIAALRPGGFTLTELPLMPAIDLRGGGDAFHAAALRALGTVLPTANRFAEAGDRTVIWLGPDEWLVLGTSDDGEDIEAQLAVVLADVTAAVTDVTGNRVAFRLTGTGARDLLAAGCSLDLHPRAFGPGRCAQTLLARTGVILLQRDDVPSFDILVRRSFASYLRAWLASAADVANGR